MKESNREKQGGLVEGWKKDRCAGTPKQSYCQQDNLNLKQMKTTVPTSRHYQKTPQRRRKRKALIAPRVQVEKSLRVIDLPFLPPSLEEEGEPAGMRAQTAMSSRPIQ